MASGIAAKINFKNMDYFKFKRIVIDGNRDDYPSCSRELRMLCDSVQTLAFRDEQFADDQALSSNEIQKQTLTSDTRHFDEILTGYRQILAGKRIDPLDIRVKTGWWADNATSSTGTAGKFKMAALRDTLLSKSNEWRSRHSSTSVSPQSLDELDLPGIFVFKHRERQCFQFVGRASSAEKSVFIVCNDLLKASFEGARLAEPLNSLSALLVVSMAADWDFYFVSVSLNENDAVLRIVENDLVLKHDSLWPRGLNRMLHVTSPLEVAQLRSSCLRHRWPPADSVDVQSTEIDISRVRLLVKNTAVVAEVQLPVTSSKQSSKPPPTTITKSHETPAVPPHINNGGHDVVTKNDDQLRSSDVAAGGQKSHSVAAATKNQQSPRVPAASAKMSTATLTGASTPRARPASAPRPSGSAMPHQPRPSFGDPSATTTSRPKSATSSARKDPKSESTPPTNNGASKTGRASESQPRSSTSAVIGHVGVASGSKKATNKGTVAPARQNAKSSPSSTENEIQSASNKHRVEQVEQMPIGDALSSAASTTPTPSASTTTSADVMTDVTQTVSEITRCLDTACDDDCETSEAIL